MISRQAREDIEGLGVPGRLPPRNKNRQQPGPKAHRKRRTDCMKPTFSTMATDKDPAK